MERDRKKYLQSPAQSQYLILGKICDTVRLQGGLQSHNPALKAKTEACG